MYPKTYNPSRFHSSEGRNKHLVDVSFKCMHCQAYVYVLPVLSGVQNRNHCPYCLYSRHVDHAQTGDRLAACKASMQPIGLTVKHGRNKYCGISSGELMLIHRCRECGKLSINRIAADDRVDRLMEVFYSSIELDGLTRQQVAISEIHLLQRADLEMVLCQLQGCTHV